MFLVDRTAFGLPYALGHLAFDVPSGRRRARSPVYICLKTAEIAQVCPMSGPSFRQLAAFRISFWSKQIGSEDGVFGDREALLGRPSECPTTKSRLCSLFFREGKRPQNWFKRGQGFRISTRRLVNGHHPLALG